MFELIFFVLLVVVFGKLFKYALKATWGIAKILVTVVLLPLMLVALVLGGLIYIAFPILAVVGIVMMFCKD